MVEGGGAAPTFFGPHSDLTQVTITFEDGLNLRIAM